MRAIDADRLLDRCKFYHLPNGDIAVPIIDVQHAPTIEIEQHIDADGTLWITVPDIERVTRVIVDEEESKFCRQFYMDAQPQRTGKWILDRSGAYCCSECLEPCAGYVMMKPRDKFCKMCGARMTEGDAE